MSVDLSHSQRQDARSLVPATSAEDKQTPLVPDRRSTRTAVKAEQRRADRHDAVAVWGEKRAAVRAERAADREQNRARRAERRADRAAAQARLQTALMVLAQRVLVVGPILAPMAVAWTGQSQFAIQILNWPFIASLLYAAAYELTTVYWAWLYHQARTDGDSGWEYRLGTWVFAAGAAVQQWWHYSDHWDATPRAVTYSVMSAVGVLLWEGRARLLHRRTLRAEGKLSPARPRIGLVRWARYPVRSWTAWSLTILEGHRTLDDAWTAADHRITDRRLQRTAVRYARKTDRALRKADRRSAGASAARPGPDRADHPEEVRAAAAVNRLSGPADHSVQAAGPLDRAAAAGPSGPARRTAGPLNADHPVRSGPVRTAVRDERPSPVDRASGSGPAEAVRPGPHGSDHTDQSTALDRTDQPAGRTANPTGHLGGPDQQTGPNTTTVRRTTRTGPAAPAARPAGPPDADHPDRSAGVDLELTETEQEALQILRAAGRTVSKRNVADVVRNQLGRSIASERAAEIARHHRSLQAA
ncbi:hypothetical protein [Kitasatospora sp. NPDC004272]